MGRDPVLQGGLHEGFAGQLLLLRLQSDAQLLNQVVQLGPVIIHTGLHNSLDGVIHKLHEPTLAGGCSSVFLAPFLGGGIKEIVSPQLLHHLLLLQIHVQSSAMRSVVKDTQEASIF